MRYGRLIVILVLALLGGLFLWGVSVRAASGAALPAASPSASPSVEPTATPGPVLPPADAGTVRRAIRQRTAAIAAWREWNRARSALSQRVVRFGVHSAAKPDRAEPRARWLAAGLDWKRDAVEYGRRTAKLVKKMEHPGGTSSGTRWAALALWLKWPRSAIHTLTSMIWFESSGRERALNDVIDCTGLTQVWPKHVTDRTGMSWSAAIRWLMIAENNLREALRIFKAQGNRFKPAWAGDPAVEAVE